MDTNMVEVWLRRDPARWIAGAISGIIAGVMAFVLVGFIAHSLHGYEVMYPIKLMGTVFAGPGATDTLAHSSAVLAGIALIGLIGGFWGFVFGHFVYSNSLCALVPMGMVWAAFSWVFTWNLYLHSVPTIRFSGVSAASAIPVCVLYGLFLSVIKFLNPKVHPVAQKELSASC